MNWKRIIARLMFWKQAWKCGLCDSGWFLDYDEFSAHAQTHKTHNPD